MKNYFLGLITGLALVAIAAVTVEITVPNASVSRIMAAFNGLSGKMMSIEVMSDDTENPLDGRWGFKVPVKDPNETAQNFAKRFTKELVRSSVRLYESAEAYNDYREAVSQIQVPDVNVPDGIVE